MALPFEATVRRPITNPLLTMANRNDLFSRFVNWLSASGRDLTAISRQGGNTDPFSRLMNRISG